MQNTISFKVGATFDTSESGIRFMDLEVAVLVNGMPLMKESCGFAFDTAALLAQQLTPGEFYPYTCSCGVAGCAGIFEGVSLSVAGDTLTWSIPEEPLHASLSPAVKQLMTGTELSFSAHQYQDALDSLVAKMHALVLKEGMPVYFQPGSFPHEERLEKPLTEVLKEDREWLLDWIEENTWRERVFGPLRNAEVIIGLSNGLNLGMNIEWLAKHIVEQAAETDDENESRALREPIVATFHADPENVYTAVRSIAWEHMWDLTYVESYGSMVDTEAVQNQWDSFAKLFPSATLTLRRIDES